MQQSVIQATQNYNAAAALAGANVNLPLGAASQNSFDALAVTFEVSSAKPLDHAYAVISARYQDRDGVAGNWIYAKALGPIGAALKKVKIEQGGFPAGFQLQDFQVHLYNGSEEIATNVSPKRVPLTPDEAFEFVVMDYVGSHKGATLPAVPAMGKLPPDLASRIAGGEFKQTFYVKVSKDGLANDVFRDRSCVSKVDDPYLLSVVESLRFKPALENGKPVDGVAALKLGQLM
jgi:hypothetical protein